MNELNWCCSSKIKEIEGEYREKPPSRHLLLRCTLFHVVAREAPISSSSSSSSSQRRRLWGQCELDRGRKWKKGAIFSCFRAIFPPPNVHGARAHLAEVVVPLLCFLVLCILKSASGTSDAEALLALKASLDIYNSLPWRREDADSLCSSWKGVKECSANGRVTKLVLEYLSLTGALKSETLAPLDQLRVLSFKSNALFGPIPELSPLRNLKSLYLNNNRFNGRVPPTLVALHRIKVVDFSNNLLSGPIPKTLASLPRLYALFLQNNNLTGEIPPFNQQTLRYFNVASNNLSGTIPATKTLARFDLSSFDNNPNLCGAQIHRPCSKNPAFAPSPSPNPLVSSSVNSFPPAPPPATGGAKSVAGGGGGGSSPLSRAPLRGLSCSPSRHWRCSRGPLAGRGRWRRRPMEGEGSGAEQQDVHDGGAAEGVGGDAGAGTVGSTYKAVMESGFIVTVKRLREGAAAAPAPARGAEEFRARMEAIGGMRHPNLVPLRAYFHAKEERLLVYDYFPNGSLFSLIHGSRPSGSGKPLHWTSCLKIAEDVATGLLFLHQQSPPAAHGNLKSSNVLLGADFESCLTDYCLVPSFLPAAAADSYLDSTATATAPPPLGSNIRRVEISCALSYRKFVPSHATCKTPFQDLVEEHGADIPKWVRSVREEETESGDDQAAAAAAEEKVGALLNIAVACVAVDPEKRPATKEVLRMIREARAESMAVSSNSSDRSPGRWSDTVQSLPREQGSESFAGRD
uniref:Protein kinase domain-containing protein n=1 Tax=Ananas comosus var. bracteatus TaxID=296719 RepID=A0A6V7NRB9_ANACO|nr:unnamed protein product [Ananas comosus var. bracteatus]